MKHNKDRIMLLYTMYSSRYSIKIFKWIVGLFIMSC